MKDYSLKNLALYFLKLGALGFGGSVVLARIMQKDLVEKRKWLSDDEFLRGLTLSQLAPGPLAAQLAIYIGYIKASILGATVAGVTFVLPSFLMVLVIGILYSKFSNLSFMQSALFGIGAAVIGIIAYSGYSLTKKTMKNKFLLWFIYVVIFLLTVVTKSVNILFFIGAGLLTVIFYSKERIHFPRDWKKTWVTVPIFLYPSTLMVNLMSIPLIKIFTFFFLAGSIAFGGGLAILPFLQHGVIQQYHWLNNKQFVDAVSVAMITPGPVVIAATFIGYFAGQIPGAVIATIAIFLPVYLIVIFLTPLFNKHAQNPQVVAFIEGVLAAAMASIAGSVVLLGQESMTNTAEFVIAVLALVATKFFKVPSVIIVLAAGLIGILIFH